MESTVITNTVRIEDNFLYRLGILGKVCLYFAVAATVLYVQIADRHKEANTYYTNDHNDTTRGGVFYTCGCSLPSSLQKKPTDRDLDTSSDNLNICYDSSRLETVTVFMYSESAALLEPRLEPTINDLASYNTIYRTVKGGYSVRQQAHDLTGYINNSSRSDDELPIDLANLYLNRIRAKEIHPIVEDLQSSSFTSFPRSYVRLTFTFICHDCNQCKLTSINDFFKEAVHGSDKDEAWANCFYWNGNNCDNGNRYSAKCLLYPTEMLPASFAIQRFFSKFMLLPKVQFTTPMQNEQPGNRTTLEPSSMYLNISQVNMSNSSSTHLRFVEVVQGSALWASLLTMFPNLGDCADMPDVEVCNGTSVCNVFSNANSYDLKCLHMNDTTKCKTLMGETQQNRSRSTFDNAESVRFRNGNSSDVRNENRIPWLDMECPGFSCETVPPYSLNWNTSEKMKNDSLNRFLTSAKLNDYWAQHSGVCTNTYTNVLRFPSRTPQTNASADLQKAERNNSNTIFLESKCKNPTASATYCWLTGNYHNMNDTPAAYDTWKKLEDKKLFPDPDRLFVCYRLDDQKFGSWFIATVGILFGWLGTVDLVLKSKRIIIPVIKKFRDHMHARRVARIQRRLLQQDDPPQMSLY